MSGDLRSPQPFEARGAVVGDPAVSSLFLEPVGTQVALDELVVTADKARIDIARRYASELPEEDWQVSHETHDVTDARFQLKFLRAAPEVFVYAADQGELEISGAACSIIENPDDAYTSRNPLPSRVPADVTTTTWNGFWGKDLRADCHAGAAGAVDPTLVRFTEVDVLLSSTELGRLIRTGTFQEPVVPGAPLTRTVHQVLYVEFADAPLKFEYAKSADARFYSPAFTVAGELEIPAAQGTLEWGELALSGDVPSTQATGAFSLRWMENHYIGVEGETIDEPPAYAEVAVPAPPNPVREVLVVAAVGVGIGLLALAGWFLFSKIVPGEALLHPRRARILELVRHEPGVEANTVARTLGISWSNALYHIVTLQRLGHVRVHRLDGRTALFSSDSPYYNGDKERVALLRRPAFRRLYEVLQQNPGLDQAELVRRLRRGQPAVSKTLRRLQQAGLVQFERVGRTATRYHAVAPANHVLEAVRAAASTADAAPHDGSSTIATNG